MQNNDYCKLYLGYADYFDPLEDAEVGRLVRAMMQYKREGTEPAFPGNERYVWPAIKRDIDFSAQRQKEISEARRNAGKKGGRPRNQSRESIIDGLVDELGFDFSPAVDYYLKNVCATPTDNELREFSEIAAEIQDNECVVAVIETCLELRHNEWPYIRAALRQKIDSGEDYMEALRVSENIRRERLKFLSNRKEGRSNE